MAAVDDMYATYYAKMSTRIQKWWRGYYMRSRNFDYYALKRWIKMVIMRNEELLCDMKTYRHNVESNITEVLEEEAKKWVLFILFKLHHLLRTKTIPGIYSSLYSTDLTMLEEQLKTLKYTDYQEVLHKQRKAMRNKMENKPHPVLEHKGHHYDCEAFWYKRNRAGKPSIIAQEEYKDEKALKAERHREKLKKELLYIHEKPMKFSPVKYKYNSTQYLYKGPYTGKQCSDIKRDSIHDENIKKFITCFPPIELFNHLKHEDYYTPYLPPYESESDLFVRRHQEKCFHSGNIDSKKVE